jgi:demethylmenaquinone methyltransferase/2-methoxy-6-polyprenyl-1,4-benzoquinol methylase
VVSVAFGLRNMTHKDRRWPRWPRPQAGRQVAGAGVFRVAKPLEKAYDWYSFKVLPRLGSWVAGRSQLPLPGGVDPHASGPGELKALMMNNGFGHVDYHNLTGGLVALHVGIKC